MSYFILTFEYFDKSGFHVCGLTLNPAVANAWRAAGNGEHRVYRVEMDFIRDYATGWKEWK